MNPLSSTEGESAWTPAIELERLRASGRATVKLGSKQLALFLHDGTVHACNNRCPHEGYPLVEGALDARAACSPATGTTGSSTSGPASTTTAATACASIRSRSTTAGVVWVDARDAPAEERMRQALDQLDAAMAEHDAPRIARELARLGRAGATPEVALRMRSSAATSGCATA